MDKLITIYHGSEKIVEQPAFGEGKINNDFGLGFYCVEIEELAKEWAVSALNDGFANCYTLDTEHLNVLNLYSPNYTILNWIAVLVEHRLFSIKTPVARRAKKYLMENFGISVEQLAYAMQLVKLGEQIVIKSKFAFSKLKYEGFDVAEKDKYYVSRKSRNDDARIPRNIFK